MEKNEKIDKIEFYAECDRLFGQTHAPPRTTPWRGRTGRWGPRDPGAGRFEGYGIVRWFNSRTVHVSLRHPVGMHMITTPEEALATISGLLKDHA
jgi:hypothetical protein